MSPMPASQPDCSTQPKSFHEPEPGSGSRSHLSDHERRLSTRTTLIMGIDPTWHLLGALVDRGEGHRADVEGVAWVVLDADAVGQCTAGLEHSLCLLAHLDWRVQLQ